MTAAHPSAPVQPGDVLIVRAAFDAPKGAGKARVTLEAGQAVEVDRVLESGRLLLRGFWADFDPARFDRAPD